jgi:hypothetical protein
MPSLENDAAPALPYGRHDAMLRRKAQRNARERGCWVYIPAETLVAAGIDPKGPVPYFRTWAGRGGSVLLRLYKTR